LFFLRFCFTASSSLSLVSPPDPSALCLLSLHDALPICRLTEKRAPPSSPRSMARYPPISSASSFAFARPNPRLSPGFGLAKAKRSEEHTSELQSREKFVCRLLLENKK